MRKSIFTVAIHWEIYFLNQYFDLPENLDDWPNEHEDVSVADVDNVKHSTGARERFATHAIQAGYSEKAIFRPRLRGWMLAKLRERRFQEKQVDGRSSRRSFPLFWRLRWSSLLWYQFRLRCRFAGWWLRICRGCC